jgi:hypothetical protein
MTDEVHRYVGRVACALVGVPPTRLVVLITALDLGHSDEDAAASPNFFEHER